MAAGKPKDCGMTRFPGGVALHQFIGAGAAAGDVTVTGVIKTRDTLQQVAALVLSGVLVKSFADYTNEFTLSADNTINNTGGTSTAGAIVFAWVARKSA